MVDVDMYLGEYYSEHNFRDFRFSSSSQKERDETEETKPKSGDAVDSL